MGINMEGTRDILALWVGPTGGESPKFWLTLITELKNRGVTDVLMRCRDGLKGLPDSARATWPLVDVQLRVVHLVRNSLRFVSKKHGGPITRQLKAIYAAPGLTAAEQAFEEFAEQWDTTYPAMIKSWRDTWDDFIPFLEFPAELHKIMYSTNAIESLNARLRKAAVRRGHFPTEQAGWIQRVTAADPFVWVTGIAGLAVRTFIDVHDVACSGWLQHIAFFDIHICEIFCDHRGFEIMFSNGRVVSLGEERNHDCRRASHPAMWTWHVQVGRSNGPRTSAPDINVRSAHLSNG